MDHARHTSDEAVKVCPNCHHEFTVAECADCGVPLVDPRELKVAAVVRACRGCGERMPDDARCCRNCATSRPMISLPQSIIPTSGCFWAAVFSLPFIAFLLFQITESVWGLVIPLLPGVILLLLFTRASYPWKRMVVTWDTLSPDQKDLVRHELKYNSGAPGHAELIAAAAEEAGAERESRPTGYGDSYRQGVEDRPAADLGPWIRLPVSLNHHDSLSVKAELTRLGAEHRADTVTTHVSRYGGGHTYELYVPESHAQLGAIALRDFYMIEDPAAMRPFTGACPACGDAMEDAWECESCGLGFRGKFANDDPRVEFIRRWGGFAEA